MLVQALPRNDLRETAQRFRHGPSTTQPRGSAGILAVDGATSCGRRLRRSTMPLFGIPESPDLYMSGTSAQSARRPHASASRDLVDHRSRWRRPRARSRRSTRRLRAASSHVARNPPGGAPSWGRTSGANQMAPPRRLVRFLCFRSASAATRSRSCGKSRRRAAPSRATRR
jgi:hypothetical protein